MSEPTKEPTTTAAAAPVVDPMAPMELFALGTKNYWLRKYPAAATCLSSSSEMLVEQHKDDKHDQLGNVYLFYGKTLLELAREEGDPLGDGVPKEVGFEPEEADDSKTEEGGSTTEADVTVDGDKNDEEEEGNKTDAEKSEKKEDKEDADISMNGESASTTSKSEATDKDEEETEADDEAETGDGEDDDDSDGDEDAGEGGSADKEEDIEEAEPSDLQLAWEVLELAKVIFERRGEAGREDYADCLITLGEVSLESENFESAIADITEGLAVQRALYTESKDMRKLAQTYYKLGMALTADNQIDAGVENYGVTLKLLAERLVVLKALDAPGVSDAEEVKEINLLIPELEEKISDLKTYKEEAVKKKEEPSPSSSPEKKATNITHLVKRKRKLEDVAGDAAATAAKKAAQDKE